MRTTIELPDEQRARLLEIAARRGEKGFSTLIQEAVAAYLRSADVSDGRVKKALEAGGSLGDEEADDLRVATRRIRARWR
jgi:predicted transcriptional regulator